MTAETAQTLRDELQTRAQALGFDAFGITTPDARPDLPAKLKSALDQGWHAGMDWMADTASRREAPQNLWADVRSIIMVGMNYGPDSDPIADLAQTDRANISVYARNRDYHDVIKGKIKELAGLLARRAGAEVKVFVDTAPVMEKPLAEAAGLGWQGKHSALVSREFGSWLFLGAIFTAAEMPVDQPHPENCGTCTKCLDICPTNAFPAPFRLDASKCLAYYSNEHSGIIPHEFRKPMGNRVFGCDDCLAVCPWNSFARQTRETKLRARTELTLPALAEMLQLDDNQFRQLFRGSPVKRLGHARFIRNVLIATGNSGDKSHLTLTEQRIRDREPVIRATAVWAAGQLANAGQLSALREKYEAHEKDAMVLNEWKQL